MTNKNHIIPFLFSSVDQKFKSTSLLLVLCRNFLELEEKLTLHLVHTRNYAPAISILPAWKQVLNFCLELHFIREG